MSGCRKLQTYPSAKRALKSMKRQREKANPGARVPVRRYFCRECDGWHLTSMPLVYPRSDSTPGG